MIYINLSINVRMNLLILFLKPTNLKWNVKFILDNANSCKTEKQKKIPMIIYPLDNSPRSWECDVMLFQSSGNICLVYLFIGVCVATQEVLSLKWLSLLLRCISWVSWSHNNNFKRENRGAPPARTLHSFIPLLPICQNTLQTF